MRITRVHATWVQVPIPPERQHLSDFGRQPTFDSVIVRVETDAGVTGWGEGRRGQHLRLRGARCSRQS